MSVDSLALRHETPELTSAVLAVGTGIQGHLVRTMVGIQVLAPRVFVQTGSSHRSRERTARLIRQGSD